MYEEWLLENDESSVSDCGITESFVGSVYLTESGASRRSERLMFERLERGGVILLLDSCHKLASMFEACSRYRIVATDRHSSLSGRHERKCTSSELAIERSEPDVRSCPTKLKQP